MKFDINQNILIETLQKLQGPTSFRQNFPVLNCILIETGEGKIKLTTTDLDITIISYIDASVKKEGKVAVPAKHFIPIIRELPREDISFELVKNNLLIKCGKIEFKISTMDPEEFPKVAEEKKKTLIKLDAQDLAEMIRLTSFCAGTEDSNYVLNGILFQLYENTIQLVATDARRLSFISGRLPASQSELHSKIEFILPLKSVNELFKIVKDQQAEIFLFLDKNNIGFDFRNTIFISKPIEGDFPRFETIIPQPINTKLIVERKIFLAALRRAELLSSPDHKAVKLELKKEEINIYKSTPQLGEVKESLPAQYNGGHLTVMFNAIFLIDGLKNIDDDTVSFELSDPVKPMVMRRDGYLYMVMPLKIKED